MENYNTKIREIVESWVENGANLGLDTNVSIASNIQNIYDFYSESADDEIDLNKIVVNYLLIVSYLDAYKMYSYRQKECINSDLDEEVFGILSDLENFDDLFEVVCEDPNLFYKMLRSSYEFSTLSYLGKSIIMKSLTESENAFLSYLFPVHDEDMRDYGNMVDIDTIINYIDEKQQYQEKIMGIEFKGGVLANVLGYIRNLIKLDYENAISLLLEIGKIDYATSKYIYEKTDYKNSANEYAEDIESILDHIDMYENYSTAEILARLVQDQEFLKDALWLVASGYVYKNFADVKLSPSLIESKKDSEVAKKLVLSNI